jgi:hypothetical protein
MPATAAVTLAACMTLVAYDRGLTLRLNNQLKACMLYSRIYNYGCEMVVFIRTNIFITYEEYFRVGRYVHLLHFQEMAASKQKYS